MTVLEAGLDAAPPIRAVREALAGTALADVWIVGGALRDAVLGRAVDDVDLAVRGDPEAVARAVADRVGGAVFSLSDAFGTWRALARDRSWVCDVSPLRGGTIEADLSARDFTVNAMAVPLAGGELVDPHGGLADLRRGALRVVRGPDGGSAYDADPLRPLRLVRLATELGLEPEPETERLTREAAPRVAAAAGERVFAELRHLLGAERLLAGLAMADRLGLVAALLPELEALKGVEQSHYHHLDVYAHTMEVLRQLLDLEARPAEAFGQLAPRLARVLEQPLADELTRSEALRLAALLHDIGKPATRGTRPDGRVTFIGHDAVGAEMVGAICRRLATSERLRSFLAATTRHHLVLGFMVRDQPLSRAAAYRYLITCQPVEVEVTVLSCADRLATRGRRAGPAIAVHFELARELMAEALVWRVEGPPAVPVRGDELAQALGLSPGPKLGALLARLQEARFTGEIETRQDAVELARRVSEDPAG